MQGYPSSSAYDRAFRGRTTLNYLWSMRLFGSSTLSVVSAVSLLATWLVVVGLEVTHQWGHLVAGCSHHEHHGVHAHHHADCTTWEGPHESSHLDSHEHVCDVCKWQWLPVGEAKGKMGIDVGPEWTVALTMGEVVAQGLTSPHGEAHAQRGPPARG